MFRSRKTRRRDRSNSIHSRRLGVELMENRMMLSATGTENAEPVLDTTQFHVIPLYAWNASDATLTPQASDGGFIQYRFEPAHPDLEQNIGNVAFNQNATSDAIFDSQLFGVAGKDINVRSAWQLNTAFDSEGLQPAVIVSQTNGGVGGPLAPDLKPVVLGPPPGVSEGGSIPIHAIFADFRKDSQLASGVKAVASPTIESSIESLTAARQLSTPDNALPGEWARAMVFEIAGGEPTASDLHSLSGQGAKTSDSDNTLGHAEPLSAVHDPHENLNLASVRHTVVRPDGASAGEMTQSQAEQQSRQLAAVVMQLLDSTKLAAGFSAPLSASQFSAGNLLITKNPDHMAFASAAVFDQLGQENAAMIESSVEGKSWLRSIGTSPLLMVLALERIAALNSRRAARESRIAAAKKPLRLRSY
jgi:hypothetical protein